MPSLRRRGARGGTAVDCGESRPSKAANGGGARDVYKRGNLIKKEVERRCYLTREGREVFRTAGRHWESCLLGLSMVFELRTVR